MVTRVAFSPDGKYLASRGGLDGMLKLWDPMTGTMLQKFSGLAKINPWRFNHDSSLAISPDSKTVAVTARKAIVLFDAASGAEKARWADSHNYGIALAYSPDGKVLASGGVDEGKDVYSLRLWDAEKGKEIRRCTLPKNEPPTYLQFAPGRNDRLAAVVAEDNAHVFDVDTGKESATIKHYWPSRLVYAPDGKSLATAGSGPVIRHWNAESGEELFSQFDGHKSGVSGAALSADGKLVASAGEQVRIWERETGKPKKSIAVKGGATAVAFSPDGKLIASVGRDRIVHLFDVEKGESVKELKGHKNPLAAVAFSPDGKLLASGDVQATIRIWDVQTGNELKVIDNKSGTEALTLAFSPDSKSLACAGAWNDSSFLPKAGTEITINGKKIKWDGNINIQGVEMSRKEGYFVLVWDTANGQEKLKLGGLKDKIRSVVYSTDGKLLAATSRDGRVGVWDAASGKEKLFFLAHPNHADAAFRASPCVAFGSDNQTLITAGEHSLRTWNVASGQELKQFATSGGAVTALATGADGKTAITAGSDGSLLIWDLTLPAPAPKAGSKVITLQ
jgi:WD40 repeat protein